MKKLILSLSILLAANGVHAAEDYASGNLSNVSTLAEGIIVMVDSGVPGNCAGTPYGWLLVRKEHSTMTAMVMAMWMTGNKAVTIYTKGMGSSGFCEVTQVDPVS